MSTTRRFDFLNRLTQIASTPSGSAQPAIFNYQYNDANQRTRSAMSDGSWWSYTYDDLGQVLSGKRYWSDGAPVAGQQFEYAFDDIGNRTSSAAGGDQTGGNLRSAAYTVTSVNHYTNRTVPAAVDVLGVVTVGATVSVNGDTDAYRHGEYFRKELSVTNSGAETYPTYVAYPTLGANGPSTTGSVFVAKSPEVFSHDADGNLTGDGRWTYSWDPENRLTDMVSHAGAPPTSRRWIQFGYDPDGRRIWKSVNIWTNSTWYTISSNRFIYHDWNLIGELNGTNNAVIRTYLWGNDLSGSLQGAGGVGGLLAVRPQGNGPAHLPAYDGNGNVAGLYDVGTTSWSARYEYGPFGEVVRRSGSISQSNPMRFATRYVDSETGLSLHGYRYYSVSTGRWTSRDPMGEHGGANVYGYCNNRPIEKVDPYGLDGVSFVSEGKAYRDPDFWSRPRSGFSFYTSIESGKLKAPIGFARQTVYSGGRGGLCNSGGESALLYPTTFVTITASNTECGCQRVRFSCAAIWLIVQYKGMVRDSYIGWTAKGNMLDHTIGIHETKHTPTGEESWVGVAEYTDMRSFEKNMEASESYKALEVRGDVAMQSAGALQAGFYELVYAKCSADVVGKCH